eukprot:CAMPEP_0118855720 /NCGR_PEP_ID=MMETSP1163-20130328/3452_1 /TAXON_ID=124430 /ORGANISM="Phaeomonas parva, Strain CCMP2877" /LENGTH=41 /DNA_ID= /DNA_START= /DNA_END= /DNA_ORIENTATION=
MPTPMQPLQASFEMMELTSLMLLQARTAGAAGRSVGSARAV